MIDTYRIGQLHDLRKPCITGLAVHRALTELFAGYVLVAAGAALNLIPEFSDRFDSHSGLYCKLIDAS